MSNTDDFLAHHGILGMKWGVRRYQNEDGTRTTLGKRHERELEGNARDRYNSANKAAAKRRSQRDDAIDSDINSRLESNYNNRVKGVISKRDYKKNANAIIKEGGERYKESKKQYKQDLKDNKTTEAEGYRQDRNAKLKRGAAIAAGVLATAAAGYALYKTGAGEKAFASGKEALTKALQNSKAGQTLMSDLASKASSVASAASAGGQKAASTASKAATVASVASKASEGGIGIPLHGQKAASAASKAASAASTASKVSEGGIGIPLNGRKVATTVANSAPSSNTSTGVRIPVGSASAARAVSRAASTTPAANAGSTAGRRVVTRIVSDNGPAASTSMDSISFSPRAMQAMNRAQAASSSLDASANSAITFSRKALRKMNG